MEVKIEIKSIFGKVLFEFSKDNNTLKETIEEAVKRYADLRGADLRGADLRGADLRGAYLGDADLGDANLGSADLRDAYLRYANLGGAYLGDANLGSADLRGAYLRYAYLGGAYLRDANLRGAYLGDAGKLTTIDDILIIGPIGSRKVYTQIYRTDNGVYVKCGCFFGTLGEFAEKVHETHSGTQYEVDYNNLISYVKMHFGIANEAESLQQQLL